MLVQHCHDVDMRLASTSSYRASSTPRASQAPKVMPSSVRHSVRPLQDRPVTITPAADDEENTMFGHGAGRAVDHDRSILDEPVELRAVACVDASHRFGSADPLPGRDHRRPGEQRELAVDLDCAGVDAVLGNAQVEDSATPPARRSVEGAWPCGCGRR